VHSAIVVVLYNGRPQGTEFASSFVVTFKKQLLRLLKCLKSPFVMIWLYHKPLNVIHVSHMAKLQAEDFERSGGPLAIWTDENMERLSCHPWVDRRHTIIKVFIIF